MQEGMVVEEPDIELGTSIASKAISQRFVAGPLGKRRKLGWVRHGGRRGGR